MLLPKLSLEMDRCRGEAGQSCSIAALRSDEDDGEDLMHRSIGGANSDESDVIEFVRGGECTVTSMRGASTSIRGAASEATVNLRLCGMITSSGWNAMTALAAAVCIGIV